MTLLWLFVSTLAGCTAEATIDTDAQDQAAQGRQSDASNTSTLENSGSSASDDAGASTAMTRDSSSSDEKSGSCGSGKAEVCHNGSTLCVSTSAVSAHVGHGDTACACGVGGSFMADSDRDGFGDPAATVSQCSAPQGYVPASSDPALQDCDDAVATVNPAAVETCNGIDDDCDDAIDDEDLPVAGQHTYIPDGDGDGFGLSDGSSGWNLTTCAATAPPGYVAAGGLEDCDDEDAAVNPSAEEACNGIDDNCDGEIDAGSAGGSSALYLDADGDGYGNPAAPLEGCAADASGYVAEQGDCDDTNSDVHPGATETCDGLDGDCDGQGDAVTSIAAGMGHSLATCSDGSALAWGDNGFGQLAADVDVYNRALPGQVPGLTDVVAVAGGFYHSLALRRDGTVWAWGYNGFGELGDGSDEFYRIVPVQVVGLSGVVAISAGSFHSLALRGDGTVWAWGNNGYGALGDGTDTYTRNAPVQASGLDHVVAISAGADHSTALLEDGTVWTWGYNGDGELGDGSPDYSRNVPGMVPGLSGVVEVAAGGSHTLALRHDGKIAAWGYNGYGEVGDGSDDWARLTPVDVVGIEDAVSIGAGGLHSLAVLADGSVMGWGYNADGELGDGSNAFSYNLPIRIAGLNGVSAVTGGYSHSLLLGNDGKAHAAGFNYYGQLGDGTHDNRNAPVLVRALP